MKISWATLGAIVGSIITGYGGFSAYANTWRFSPNTCVGPNPIDINQMWFYLLLASAGLVLILVSICLMEVTNEDDERNEMWNRINYLG